MERESCRSVREFKPHYQQHNRSVISRHGESVNEMTADPVPPVIAWTHTHTYKMQFSKVSNKS